MFVVNLPAFMLTDAVINAACAVMSGLIWMHRRSDTCLLFWAGSFLHYTIVATVLFSISTTPLWDSVGFAGIVFKIVLFVAGFRAFDGRRPLTPGLVAVSFAPPAVYLANRAFGMDAMTAVHAAQNTLIFVSFALGLLIVDIRRPAHAPRNIAACATSLVPGILTVKNLLGMEWFDLVTMRGLLVLSHNIVTVILIVSILAKLGERDLHTIRHMAQHDPLTGALNRSGLASAVMAGTQARTVLLADLDHFKSINDRFGHSGGDEVLRAFAERTRQAIDHSALLVRLGGEEFLIVSSRSDSSDAERLAERVRLAAKSEPVRVDKDDVSFTVSIGVAIRHQDEDLDHAIKRADTALYKAKKGGRDRAVAWSPDRAEALDAVAGPILVAET